MISTKGRYALRVMLDIARHSDGQYISLKEISQRQGLSVKYLEQVVPPLSRAGLLLSLRGSGGGYKLSKSPQEYTAGEILRAAEGSLAPIACLEFAPNQCPRRQFCQTLPFWQGYDRVVRDYVDSVTLDQMLQQAPEEPPAP